MKIRQIQTYVKLLSGFFIVLTLFIALSCDQPQMIVESDGNDNQIYLISHSVDSSWSPDEPVNGKSATIPQDDSSFIITYKRFEDYSVRNSLTEAFRITLIHKLDGDTTLDYGTVTFAGMELYKSRRFSMPAGMIYNYTAMLVNNSDDSSYAIWSDFFRLEARPMFISKNSTHIKDFEQEIPTQQPNWIMNLDTGQIVSATRDLELIFRREMIKGSVITIGGYGSYSYYHFELLQTASTLTIPAEYLQLVKGTLTEVKCQVAYDENLFLGSLISEDKNTNQHYRVPVFEYTKGSIMVRLVD